MAPRDIPGVPRVDHHDRQACRSQGDRGGTFQAPGGFQHDQGGLEGLPPVHERAMPLASVGTAQRSPAGRRAMSHWAFTTAIPTKHGTSTRGTPVCPTWQIRAQGHHTTVRARGAQDVTTHAPLRSRRTKAQSVSHVRGLRDGDAPTSPLKDTRLLGVGSTARLGLVPTMARVGSSLSPPTRAGYRWRCGRHPPLPHPGQASWRVRTRVARTDTGWKLWAAAVTMNRPRSGREKSRSRWR